jgi:ATP-dependent DNA helicase RecG
MCSLHNGFELAEKDLQLRGSGDLIGTRQSGFTGEIEEILGLDPNLYYQISDLVESLDLADPKLPRLQKYLEKEAKTVWEE